MEPNVRLYAGLLETLNMVSATKHLSLVHALPKAVVNLILVVVLFHRAKLLRCLILSLEEPRLLHLVIQLLVFPFSEFFIFIAFNLLLAIH